MVVDNLMLGETKNRSESDNGMKAESLHEIEGVNKEEIFWKKKL